jgi:hypothetical protein
MKQVAITVAIGLLIVSACKKEGQTRHYPGTTLMTDIASGQSVDQFAAYLRALNLKSHVSHESKLSPDDRRPPFNMYELSVPNFRYLGSDGELTALFFNDRLEEVHFYPADMPMFLDKLRQAGVSVAKDGKTSRTSAATEIWFTKDEHKEFVGWRDSALAQEMADWVRRYS